MGDRYEIDAKCAYCNHLNEGVWFAPTCSAMTFKCEECDKENFITMDFKIKKIEDVTYDEVEEAISGVSNFLDEGQIKKCAKDYFKRLVKNDYCSNSNL